MSLKQYHDPEQDPDPEVGRKQLSYSRPTHSSWVAVAAVAFAFILLGGFIKTYRQLQDLQEETRHEIAELRKTIRRLQTAPPATPAQQRSRMPVLGANGRQEQDPERIARAERLSRQVAETLPAGRDAYRSEDAGNANESTIADLPAFDDPEPRGIRYQWGRRSGVQTTRALLSPSGGPCQVISVSGGNKRIMIEGGRDLSLTEGARLELCRDGRWIGDLRVVDVFDNQSSCEVLHATHPPEPGDTVRMPEKSM